MHSPLSRLNANVSCTVAALAVVSLVGFCHSFFTRTETVNATFEATNYQVKKLRRYVDTGSDNAVAFFNINLDANISGLFNWNVRQVFFFLSAVYSSKQGKNQIVAWDKIVLRDESSILKLRKADPKYYIKGLDKNVLRGKHNVSLTLSWNVIPHVGLLTIQDAMYNYRVLK